MIPDDIMIDRVYGGKRAMVFMLLEHQGVSELTLYDLARRQLLHTRTETEALDVIACAPGAGSIVARRRTSRAFPPSTPSRGIRADGRGVAAGGDTAGDIDWQPPSLGLTVLRPKLQVKESDGIALVGLSPILVCRRSDGEAEARIPV